MWSRLRDRKLPVAATRQTPTQETHTHWQEARLGHYQRPVDNRTDTSRTAAARASTRWLVLSAGKHRHDGSSAGGASGLAAPGRRHQREEQSDVRD